MPERSSEEFVRAARIRLALAVSIYVQVEDSSFGDRYVEMANVAMLVWSAGIDLVSVHMLLNGEPVLGTSAGRRRYLRGRIRSAEWPRHLRTGWNGLVRLHNFQHNLSMVESDFADDCRLSAQTLASLNSLLPATLRLSPDSYGWLAEVG